MSRLFNSQHLLLTLWIMYIKFRQKYHIKPIFQNNLTEKLISFYSIMTKGFDWVLPMQTILMLVKVWGRIGTHSQPHSWLLDQSPGWCFRASLWALKKPISLTNQLYQLQKTDILTVHSLPILKEIWRYYGCYVIITWYDIGQGIIWRLRVCDRVKKLDRTLASNI